MPAGVLPTCGHYDFLGFNVGEFLFVVLVKFLEVWVRIHDHQVTAVGVVGEVDPCGRRE